MNTLYFDCFSGISGDMTVAALLDLGADEAQLQQVLDALELPGFTVSHGDCMKGGIKARCFSVVPTREEHAHRTLRDILALLDAADIPEQTRALSEKIFRVIARAEGKVHGCAPEDVHFHEVGAVDSIVDIVSAAECVRQLAPDRIVCSVIREGRGMIACAHGKIPVPAPATLEILSAAGAAFCSTETEGEMVTPTGAGIAAALCDAFGAPVPAGVVRRVGYGAGTREFSHPNVLRALWIEDAPRAEDAVTLLEAQVDDMTGEALAFAMEQLFAAGALDAYFTPIYMKKNRPATQITALCRPEDAEQVGTALLRHTTTLGYRSTIAERRVMQRHMLQINTPYGEIPVKCAKLGEIVKYHAEFDAVCAAARRANVEVAKVQAAVQAELAQLASCNS